MKTRIISLILGLAACATACTNDRTVEFGIDNQTIQIGADGGTRTIKITSPESWIAMTDKPWLSVSPANGKGSTECQIIIDSALTVDSRIGTIRIQTQNSHDNRDIQITQEGYRYTIALDKGTVTVPNYAAYGERYFDVVVHTNAEFDVRVPDDAGWLTYDNPSFNLNRGVRPREVTVRFNWQISSQPERQATVQFVPKSSAVTVDDPDDLTVTQEAAPEIEKDTRAGDSVALLGISRSLNTWDSWESSEPMDRWQNVVLWEDGDEGCTPEMIGRVRSADFFLFETKEELPYEVQYLTAAEELKFRSNVNSFLYDLDPGEYITKLENLKRLTIQAYGLTKLNDSFKNMKNLEYLDLSANNYEDFPAVLKGGHDNFEKLRVLVLNANQRQLIYDLSNHSRTELGGFYSATNQTREFPRWLLEWKELDTLVLGVNYLQGEFPTLDDGSWTEFYTEEDVIAADSLPAGRFADKNDDGSPKGIVGLPKVWPRMKWLSVNLNRLTGNIPDWMLYHPALDWWIPFTLVFNQEGKNEDGKNSGFDNEPNTTMDYYYKFFTKKKNPYAGADSENSGDDSRK